jgi:hypothetical protein
MNFKKHISLLTSVSFLVQPISPLLAVSMSSMHEVEDHLENLANYKSVPASLNFQASQNTAAGVLHYAEHEGEIWIPLGQRDDTKEWCNFGGKSDAQEMSTQEGEEPATEGGHKSANPLKEAKKAKDQAGLTLADTADRETREESNGLYAHHPRLLRHAPFIDVLDTEKKGGLLYRMYWKKVQYLAPEVFKKKIEDATEAHSREYTDFKWFKAKDLLEAVISEPDPNLPAFYGPLMETLSTDSGIALLEQLVNLKKLNPFNKEIRPLLNRLYVLPDGEESPEEESSEEELPHANFKVHWDIPTPDWAVPKDDEKNPDGDWKPKSLDLDPRKHTFVSFGEDAFNRSQGKRSLLEGSETLIEEDVSFNAKKEEDIFAEAVAAHGAAMVELQSKSLDDNNNDAHPLLTPHWNPNHGETLSRIHLKIILGPEYQEPKDFPASENPRREADLANIKKYFTLYNSAEYEQKGKVEFKRKINFLERDFEMFADVMAYEEQNKQWPTFFHAASANLNNLFKSFTYLRELIGVKAFSEQMALRGTDIYFKDSANMADVLKNLGYQDYENNRASMVLCLNYVLLAGLATTRTTSSSVEYVINDHSVIEQNLNDRFEEAMVLAGFAKPTYDYFQSLFEQFIAHKDPELGNSVMLAIPMNPDILEDHMYAAHGGGRPFDLEDDQKQKTNSPLHVLRGLQNEDERQSFGRESFEIDKERKRDLVPEARFFLHPKNMFDSERVKVKAFNRFPLTKEEEKAHGQEMRRTSLAMLADWLAQKNEVLEGSFLDYPILKIIYKMAYKGLTGEDVKESIAVEGFLYLIQHGHIEAVETYLSLYPDILEKGGLDQKTLMNAALESNNPDSLDFVLERILKTSVQETFSEREFVKTVRGLLLDNKDKTLIYFIENYDISKISDKIKMVWIKGAIEEEYTLSVIQAIVKKAPHLFDQALEIMLESGLDADNFEAIVKSGIISSQDLLVKFSNHVRSGNLKSYGETVMPLRVLLQNGADLAAIHPETQEPIIFSFLAMTHPISEDFSNEVKKIKGLVDLKNKDGLTPLQAAQKSYLEGKNTSSFFHLLLGVLQEERRDVPSAFYPPFLKVFGPLTLNFYGDNVLQTPGAREWVDLVKNIKKVSDIPDLIKKCPSSELLNKFWQDLDRLSITSAITNLFWLKARNNGKIAEEWKEKFKIAVESNNEAEIKKLILEAPDCIHEYDISVLIEKMEEPLKGPRERNQEKWTNALKEVAQKGAARKDERQRERTKEWTNALQKAAQKGKEAMRDFLSHSYLFLLEANKNMTIKVKWMNRFQKALDDSNESEIKGLVLEAPDSIDEYDIGGLSEKVKEPLKGRRERTEEKVNEWENALIRVAQEGMGAVHGFLSDLPPYVDYLPLEVKMNLEKNNQQLFPFIKREFYAKVPKNWKIKEDWKAQLQKAVDRDNEAEIKRLILEAPDNINEHDLNPWTEKLRGPLKGRFARNEENEKEWLKKLRKAVQKGEEAVRNFLSVFPPYILYMSEDAKTILKDYITEDVYTKCVIPYREAEEKWISDFESLINENKGEKTLPKLRQHLQSAPNPGVLRNERVLSTLDTLMKDDQFIPFFGELISLIYPNKMEFIDTPRAVLLLSSDLGSEAKGAVVNAFSPQEQVALFTQMDEDHFEDILEELPSEVTQNLLEKTPELFRNHGKNKDFFSSALASLPLDLRTQFVLSHSDELFKMNLTFTVPYFVFLLADEENKELVEKLIKENPTFLDIESEDGLSLSKIIEIFPKSMKDGNKTLRMLEKYLRTH